MGRSALAVAALVTLVTLTACLKSTEFRCSNNDTCSGGVCESNGYCSFADTECPSGRRYGELSGENANQCVGSTTSLDAGTDSTGTDAPGGCPASYKVIAGSGTTHKFRKINAAQWNMQRSTCMSDGANAYLAIPDVGTELMAITSLSASARTWIGIHDQMTEGSFQTVRNANATYLPWDTGNGEPNDSGGGQDCVAALMSAALIETDKCTDSFVAVCECEP